MSTDNKKSFEYEFRQQCGNILKELYYNPMSMPGTGLKRVVLKAEKRYVDYLVELNLIKDLKSASAGLYGLQLERKGFEVFEKYNGWDDYVQKVINQDLAINAAKNRAIKYWWVPIAISLLALIVAILALIK